MDDDAQDHGFADRIERIAFLLVERRVLGGDEVCSIIADTPATPVRDVSAIEGGPHAL